MYGATAASLDTGEPWDEKGSLHDLDSELLTLRQHVEKLGSSSDGAGLRESIRSLRCELKRRISDEQVRQSGLLDQIKNELSEQQVRQSQKLQSYVSQLHCTMEEERRKLQKYPSPHRTSGVDMEETDWGGSTALPLLLSSPPLSSAARAEEEAEALEEIQRDIADLNEIQRNLTRLVDEQGKDINVIEANVGVAHVRVMKARRTLGEAAVLKASSRRKKCCIAVCVLVAVAIPVVILAILVAILTPLLT